jgi:hypothetical protein
MTDNEARIVMSKLRRMGAIVATSDDHDANVMGD